MMHNWTEKRWRLPLSLVIAIFCAGTAMAQERFLRGNANNDATVDVSDPICILLHLFASVEGDCGSPTCMDALDSNDDGEVDLSDAVYLLSFLFQGEAEPPPPGPRSCGFDPSIEDPLGCEESPACDFDACRLIRVSLIGEQRSPDLVVDEEGNAVVVWASDSDADGLFEIRGATYSPTGVERLEPFNVNDSSSGQQIHPRVAMDAGGGFIAVWESDGDSDGLYNIRARGFNADGTERIAEFEAHLSSAGQQRSPDVAVDPDGNFVIVWADDGNQDGLFNISVRVFNADGSERVEEFTANDSDAGQQIQPVVAVDATGNFVVLWEDDGNEDGLFNIEGRGFDRDGAERLAQFTAHDRDAGQQRSPAIAMQGNGDFITAWDDDRDGDSNFQVHARGFYADGTERIPRFTVNVNSAGQQINASIAVNASGEIAAAYEEDRDNDDEYHVRLRAFLPDGTETLPHIKADCIEPAQHLAPAIGIDGAGRVLVFWEDTGESQPTQVVGRRFPDPDASAVQSPGP